MGDHSSIIDAINRRRLGLGTDGIPDDIAFSSQTGADGALCVYGRMQPGGSDHHFLKHFGGTWSPCTYQGTLSAPNACTANGECPGMVWSPDGDRQRGFLLTSAKLKDAWPQLDEHEGDEYVRLLVNVNVGGEIVIANIYAARDASRTQMMLADGYNVHNDVD